MGFSRSGLRQVNKVVEKKVEVKEEVKVEVRPAPETKGEVKKVPLFGDESIKVIKNPASDSSKKKGGKDGKKK